MRIARPNYNTVFKFIPYDDSSIRLEANELADKYQEYLKTAKLSILNIDATQSPAFYWLRPLNSELWQEIRGLIKVAGETEEEKEIDDTVEAQASLVNAKVIKYCLIGVDSHPEVTGVDDDGKLIVRDWTWAVGDKEPAGVKEVILKDAALVNSMFQFIISVSVLSDNEKKA